MSSSPYIWLIIHVNPEYMGRINKDIKKTQTLKGNGLKAVVPAVKVVKKQFKNKLSYEKVPLLFNYGFLRILKRRFSEELLKDIKDKVPGVSGFLKDPMKKGFFLPEIDLDNKTIKVDRHIPYATSTKLKILKLEERAKAMGIYTRKDIKNLTPGTIITLRGYPFDGLEAEVVNVNFRSKKISVKLLSDWQISNVDIAFENAVYSVYQDGYDDRLMGHKSLEEFRKKPVNRNSED